MFTSNRRNNRIIYNVNVCFLDTAVITNEEKQDKNIVKIPEPIPQDSAFGKGKRSRIPNKKYESLGLKSFGKTFQPTVGVDHGEFHGNDPNSVENGVSNKLNSAEVTSSMDGKENELQATPIKDEQSEVTSSAHSSPSLGARSAQKSKTSLGSPTTPAKRPKVVVDLTNPCYLKPFEYGWKRELVFRATLDTNMKRTGDVYYYTPGGKKVRSMREVSENLKNKELTVDDFTFYKEPLGVNDPEKEIIRDAKIKGVVTPGSTKKQTPKVKTPKEKPTSPKMSTPAPSTPPGENAPLPVTPKPGKSPRLGGFKV